MKQNNRRLRLPEGITPGMIGVFLGGVITLAVTKYYNAQNTIDYFKIVAVVGCWIALLDMRRMNSFKRNDDKREKR